MAKNEKEKAGEALSPANMCELTSLYSLASVVEGANAEKLASLLVERIKDRGGKGGQPREEILKDLYFGSYDASPSFLAVIGNAWVDAMQPAFTDKIVDDPSVGGKREKDVSELTVQHAGDNPVMLVYLQETEEQEPVAKVRCGSGGLDKKYRRGQQINCNGRTYKVVDIDPKQMVIVDTLTEEQRVIKPQP